MRVGIRTQMGLGAERIKSVVRGRIDRLVMGTILPYKYLNRCI